MSIVSFLPDPWVVHVVDEEGNETSVPSALIAIDGEKALLERNRELFWHPLDKIMVVIDEPPKKESADD